jgi:hypothetical protein
MQIDLVPILEAQVTPERKQTQRQLVRIIAARSMRSSASATSGRAAWRITQPATIRT